MRLPYLKSWDNTPVVVELTAEGIDENGSTPVIDTFVGKCNLTNKTKTVRGKDGLTVNLGGVLTIRGDIAPAIPSLTGSVTVEGRKRDIFQGEKVRNPDGSVNHTQLELF